MGEKPSRASVTLACCWRRHVHTRSKGMQAALPQKRTRMLEHDQDSDNKRNSMLCAEKHVPVQCREL